MVSEARQPHEVSRYVVDFSSENRLCERLAATRTWLARDAAQSLDLSRYACLA
jgi:hypothetical protein